MRPAARLQGLGSRIVSASLGDIRVALAAVLVIALSAPVRSADTEAVGATQFLMMSDLHFAE